MNYTDTLSSSSQRLQKNFVCRRSFLEIRKQKLIAFKAGVGFLKSSLVATAKKPVWLLLRSHRGKSLRPRQKPLPPKSYYDICSSPKQIKNRIGVQRLVVMPSKLWRFEWSRGGTIEIKEKSRPKIGNFYDMIFMTKSSIELSYY